MWNSERLLYETNTVSIQGRTPFPEAPPSSEERGFSSHSGQKWGLLIIITECYPCCLQHSKTGMQISESCPQSRVLPLLGVAENFGKGLCSLESLRSHMPHNEAKKERNLSKFQHSAGEKILAPNAKTNLKDQNGSIQLTRKALLPTLLGTRKELGFLTRYFQVPQTEAASSLLSFSSLNKPGAEGKVSWF